MLVNPVFAEETDLKMDWIIEGQVDEREISPDRAEIISSYEELIGDAKPKKPIYDKFVTNNQYFVKDYKITIDSEEGQMLNEMIVEQQELQKDSFKHKIRYYDRFSDGYVEVAEALLDPIGNNRYLIEGRLLDHNPNSNLELFVLERGYSLDNLEAIPNDIFSPKEFTLGRQLMEQFQEDGEGGVDLRQYAINHLHMNKEQIKEKMIESLSRQSSEMFADIMSGNTLQSELQSETEVPVTAPSRESQGIFDNFEFEQSKFEDTQHVHDSLQGRPIQIPQLTSELENNPLLILIPTFVGLVILGYVMKRRSSQGTITKQQILVVTQPQVNYKELVQDMLNNSLNLYNSNKQKEAHQVLSQAIRYYYSQDLKIFKDVTNFELIDFMKKDNNSDHQRIRDWLLLCGSVGYAKSFPNEASFKEALSQFSKIIS